MTTSTDTTARAIEEARRDGAILDLQGVQALLDIIAWAEDSLPYVLAGETRRVAFMLLEQTMGQALKTLGANNKEMERDKATAAAAKAEPEPVIGTDRADRFPTDVVALCLEDIQGQLRDIKELLNDAHSHVNGIVGTALLSQAQRTLDEEVSSEVARALATLRPAA